DHLDRPIRMTNASQALVWDAVYKPYGEVVSITGVATLDARFPGQWFQLETGLHYNWHRTYDPTTGRYLQTDPLGYVDGPSVNAYASGSPMMLTDREGLASGALTSGPMTRIPRNSLVQECGTRTLKRDCYAECAHLLPSPSGDLQSSEFRRCYRLCTGSLYD
ncbi:RHS repeat-associated core domain-containing protein, partial [Bosea psychrotolerans]